MTEMIVVFAALLCFDIWATWHIYGLIENGTYQ